MHIYLCGPMSGIPLCNFPAFNAAARRLRRQGHTVWNPAEEDVARDGFNPATDKARPLKEYMAIDIPKVCTSDTVAALNGWRASAGSRCEVYVARQVGIPVVSADTLEPIDQSILQEADELVDGPRNASYGPPNQDFQRTADMWTGLLQFKLKSGERIRPQDVAWMMIMLKASRAQHTDKRDNYTDVAGYIKCGWRCVEEKA